MNVLYLSIEKRGKIVIFTRSTSATAWSVASANAHDSTAGGRASTGRVEAEAADETEASVEKIGIAFGKTLPRGMIFEELPLAHVSA